MPLPSPGESSQPRHRTHITCIGKQILYRCHKAKQIRGEAAALCGEVREASLTEWQSGTRAEEMGGKRGPELASVMVTS